jgi:hypothetical protein
LHQVGVRRKSKRRRFATVKTPILSSIGGISVVKKDKEVISGVREKPTILSNKEKSPNDPSMAVKSEEEKVFRVNARQLRTLFKRTISQSEQATSWGSLRSRLTNASLGGALPAAKVKNNDILKIYIFTVTLSVINNTAKH